MASGQWQVARFLCVVWTLTLLYGEMAMFWVPPIFCRLPDIELRSAGKEQPLRAAFIADPQLIDQPSSGSWPAGSSSLNRFASDLFMRRSFRSSVQATSPNFVFVMGDLFSSGAQLSTDSEWRRSLWRYRHIFHKRSKLPTLRLRRPTTSASRYSKVFEAAGDRDVGFSDAQYRHPQRLLRFTHTFGQRGEDNADPPSPNYAVSARSFQFVVVNAPALDGPPSDNATAAAWAFVESIGAGGGGATSRPILVTHLPLHRPEGTSCGPHRRSPLLKQVARWQRFLTDHSSARLLDTLKPALILSGHEGDHCEVTHNTSLGVCTEHVVGTFNCLPGQPPPAFRMVGLGGRQVASRLCYLPPQRQMLVSYALLAALSLLLLLACPSRGFLFLSAPWWAQQWAAVKRMGGRRERQKVKVDEEEGEVEMMFDMEGNMHLVTKPKVERKQGEAGEGVEEARGSVKARNVRQPPSGDTGDTGGAAAPAGGSKARLQERSVWRRVTGAVGPLTALCSMVMTVYAALVAKDWM